MYAYIIIDCELFPWVMESGDHVTFGGVSCDQIGLATFQDKVYMYYYSYSYPFFFSPFLSLPLSFTPIHPLTLTLSLFL